MLSSASAPLQKLGTTMSFATLGRRQCPCIIKAMSNLDGLFTDTLARMRMLAVLTKSFKLNGSNGCFLEQYENKQNHITALNNERRWKFISHNGAVQITLNALKTAHICFQPKIIASRSNRRALMDIYNEHPHVVNNERYPNNSTPNTICKGMHQT